METKNTLHAHLTNEDKTSSKKKNSSITSNTGAEENAFTRKSTFTRAFTLDGGAFTRTVTEQMRRFDPDEQFTKSVINEYIRQAEKGSEGDVPLPMSFANRYEFWKVMVIGGSIGAVMAFVALGFMSFTDNVPETWVTCDYYEDSTCGHLYQGEVYYPFLVACTGIVVGTVRWAFDYPDDLPGLFKEIGDFHVQPDFTPVTFLISALSLGGGATLGPEAAMVTLGGGFSTFVAEHVEFEDDDDRKLLVLTGMAGALGGLFPTPILSTMMLFELGNPPKQYMESIIILSFPAVISFLIFYQMVDYDTLYEEHISNSGQTLAALWSYDGFDLSQCITGFNIGCISAFLCTILVISLALGKQIFGRIREKLAFNSYLKHVVPPFIGGLIIGTVNYVLPLTVGNGRLVISAIIENGNNGNYSASLMMSSGFARILLLGVSQGCGFIGGMIYPMLTIGTLAGATCLQYYDSLPIGLAIGCFFSGIPGGIVPMPFCFNCLVYFVFYFGVYQTAPIFIASMTAYTIVCGSGVLQGLKEKGDAAQAAAAAAKLAKEKEANELALNQLEQEQKEDEEFAVGQYLGGKK